MQAINQGLIHSTEWRLAKEPHSQIAQILKAKYHPGTSIWRAKENKPKSAFWGAILKVKPLLISATLCQIVDGTSSVWSSPWFASWESIYDNLILRQQPFMYPAQVKDLWIPGQNFWNRDLINSLFSPTTAKEILETPIINANDHDTLIWKLTPTGQFSSKSAYKNCFNNLQLPKRQRPKIVPPQVISLLKQVWRDKQMAPRVQTLHGDYFEKRFQQVRGQVSTPSTLMKIALGVAILKMKCICYFCALFPKRLGSAIFGLSKLN